MNQTSSTPIADPQSHDGAVEKAMDWLSTRHLKGWNSSFRQLRDEMMAHEEIVRLSRLDPATLSAIQINLTEWILAEGTIQAQGTVKQVPDYLLGPTGPALTPGQRDWLQQMAQRPLRLYEVTDVVPGVQMTLCDTLNSEAGPTVVLERTGSRGVKPGMQIGCRILRAGEHYELSGAIYPFSVLAGQAVVGQLRATAQEFEQSPSLARQMGRALMSAWLQQYVGPPVIPTIVDTYSGDPVVLITDHYRVLDWTGLDAALGACADVEGDSQDGWSRIIDCEDGQIRRSAGIEAGKGKTKNQIEVFYRTQAYADKGRIWFDEVAGGAVAFLERKVSKPQDIMAQASQSSTKVASRAQGSAMTGIDPHMLAQAIEGVIQRTYAHWPDEPIPLLGNKTPRQAIQTAAGLERVKGLIRSYEASEKEQAAQQGRSVVSYNFLWEAIGVAR